MAGRSAQRGRRPDSLTAASPMRRCQEEHATANPSITSSPLTQSFMGAVWVIYARIFIAFLPEEECDA